MVTSKSHINLGGLAHCLIQDNLITQEKAETALADALSKRVPYVAYLVENKILDSLDIAVSASKRFGVPVFDLDAIDQQTLPRELVAEKLIRNHHALPLFKRGNRLFLAVSDPTNHQGLDEIRFNTGLASEAILVEEVKLSKMIEQILDEQDNSMDELLDADLDNLDITAGDDEGPADEGGLDVDEAPVVRYINKILLPSIRGFQTSILSPMSILTGSGIDRMDCFGRWHPHPPILPIAYPAASRSCHA